MNLLSRAKSIARILADYSLRKFLIYSAVPNTWPELRRLKIRAKEEKLIFSKKISQWQENCGQEILNPRYFFQHWLRVKPASFFVLAGDRMNVDRNSADSEIRMLEDRLGWVLQLLESDRESVWPTVEKWVADKWKMGRACRGAYSISERVSNLILLCNIHAPQPLFSTEVFRLLEQDTDYLLKHLEYHGEARTNNHILNNARALILAGAFLNIRRFYEAGCWMIESQLDKHVAEDGVVREASTHYQWVITRWMVEIGCAFQFMDPQRFKQLRPRLLNMLHVCDSMQLGKDGANYLPLLGDISPDLPPRLLGGMTRFGYALLQSGAEERLEDIATHGFWSRFFIGRAQPTPSEWQAQDSSWVRLRNHDWSLITHADVHTDDNRSTHGHHDLFSFELAFAGQPVIIDAGRGNYLAGRDLQEAGILEEWHNTILVNRKRTGFVPRGYMPSGWLRKTRSVPHVSSESQRLEIRLDNPQEIPGISCIQRTWEWEDAQTVTVTNRVLKNNSPHANAKIVLYVMGSISPEKEGLKLEIGANKFLLNWNGLSMPKLEESVRYTAYAVPESCTRLEWLAQITTDDWKTSFKISTLEDLK
jgi:Heparinase II/III-like protein